MKKFIFSACLAMWTSLSWSQFSCQELKSTGIHSAAPSIDYKAKSDTIDILHYSINLDLTEVQQRIIKGHCDITFTPKMSNVNSIRLDLLMLQIDSILLDGQTANYTYNDTIIKLNLGANLSPADTGLIKVYYQGSPQGDGSNWGGWHSQSGYYYNLGVGFAANPHTYGRAWFPCFDNFVEKSTYDFTFKTVTPLRPYANGIRISETPLLGDTISTLWQMTDPIPTYLTSVAVSNYAEINDTVNAMNGVLPIQLMAKPNDSLKLVNSFVNLKPTFHSYESAFGPYEWQKVGYAVTTVGAMEHATSIHYPVNLVNGNLGGEDIMAHELAHHWWGNLVTCETDADMWINEGMAEFSSHLYAEDVYGREKYLDIVQANAFTVLNTAHLNDDGFKAIQGLDHEYVYGTHVYQKGAMVGHNLRAYLGDNLFFSGLTTLLQNNKYGNLTSNQFRDQLAQITGQNLNDFFDNWVFNAGFPQFSVDSLSVNGNSATVKIGQRIRKAPALYSNVPVHVTFFSASGDTISRKLTANGNSTTQSFGNLAFSPAFALAGYDGVLLTGNTYNEHLLNQAVNYNGNESFMRITANSIQDSAKLIVMHNWAAPGGKIPANKDYRLSPQHYWTIQGIDLNNVDLTGRITISPAATSLDTELLKNGSDSLVVLYRKDATEPWELYVNQQKTQIGISGYIDINQLKAGDYTLANSAEKVGLKENHKRHGKIDIYPNPAKDKVFIKFDEAAKTYDITMTDAAGKLLYSNEVTSSSHSPLEISLKNISTSFVIVSVNGIGSKVSLID
ncbi:M1 family aminopeptidase [Owenweeksia hongkongensis]|uniref:M1 family aminopeptidase n=1 Tax=Owenweeksia hongkongensis TaxID=253245 RepID=UPI003A94316A